MLADNVLSLDFSGSKFGVLRNQTFIYCVKLKILEFYHVDIKVIESDAFAGLTHLMVLTIRYGNLKEWKCEIFEPLISLKYLTLSTENFSIDNEHCFQENSKLRTFSLSSKWIANFPAGLLNTTTSLEHVNLERSRIQMTALLINSKVFKIDDNRLEKLWVFPVNEEIFANNNKISTIYCSKIMNMVELSLRSNNLSDFQCINEMKSLKYLDLSYNKIEIVPENFFKNFTNLIRLYLNSNRIKSFNFNWLRSSIELRELRLDRIENSLLAKEMFHFIEKISLFGTQ